MAVLPGVLGCRPLRRTVQVRLGTNTLRLLGGTPIFVVSRHQFIKYPGFSNSDRGCLPAIALAQARRAGKPLPQENLCLLSSVLCLLSSVFCPLSSVFCLLSSVFCPLSSVFCPLSSVLCLLSSVLCPLSSVFCPLSSVLCTMRFAFKFAIRNLKSEIGTIRNRKSLPQGLIHGHRRRRRHIE